MKGRYVKDLQPDQKVSGYFGVASKLPPRRYNSKPGSWFGFRVSDKTGEIDVKFWGRSDEETDSVYSSVTVGGVVSIRDGAVSTYKDQLQITLNTPDQVSVERNFDQAELVQSAGDIDSMVAQLKAEVGAVKNPDIRRLLESVFDVGFVELYSKTPASKSHHHSYAGGLLEHSLSMASMARAAAKQHGDLDKDLLVAGCLLHDIGKVHSYKAGTIIENTLEGNLLGHIPIGAMLVGAKIDGLGGFPDVLKNKILHLILSHHGSLEAGSPVKPSFPEAFALHKIDDYDAQTKYTLQVRKQNEGADEVRGGRFGYMYLG